MAVPLTDYLGEGGSYDGFDIVNKGIRWCRKEISSRYPSFNFVHANIYNSLYNPNGNIKAIDYTFPYQDNTFDFVFLTSVFTHMLYDDVNHYLKEISRVLKQGGICFSTTFLVTSEARKLIDKGKSIFQFPHKYEDSFIEYPEYPEGIVGYEEHIIRELFKNHMLKIEEPIRFGEWCGRISAFSFQDVIIARKL